MAASTKKTSLILIGLTLLFLLLSHLISAILMREVPGADFNLVYRQIETTDKLIFNGFFGHFFRFKTFGIINLLIIPFLFRDLLRYRKLKQWQKAFLFLYVSILILIGVKGFFNPRYTLTIFPVSVVYLVYSFWNYLQIEKRKKYAKFLPFLLAFLAVYGFGKEFIRSRYETNFSEEHLESQTYLGDKNGANIQLQKVHIHPFRAMKDALFYQNLPHYKYNPTFYANYPNISERKIFDFIAENHKSGSKRILTNNLPAVYYYTDANALYYWSGDDLIFDDQGERPLLKNRTNEEVRLYLRDTMNVGYIYTYEPYNKYDDQFYRFLQDECELMEQTYNTYQLFKIKEN